jgi:hypothetical protein
MLIAGGGRAEAKGGAQPPGFFLRADCSESRGQQALRAMVGGVRSGRGETAMDILDLQYLLWGTAFGNLNHGAA